MWRVSQSLYDPYYWPCLLEKRFESVEDPTYLHPPCVLMHTVILTLYFLAWTIKCSKRSNALVLVLYEENTSQSNSSTLGPLLVKPCAISSSLYQTVRRSLGLRVRYISHSPDLVRKSWGAKPLFIPKVVCLKRIHGSCTRRGRHYQLVNRGFQIRSDGILKGHSP